MEFISSPLDIWLEYIDQGPHQVLAAGITFSLDFSSLITTFSYVDIWHEQFALQLVSPRRLTGQTRIGERYFLYFHYCQAQLKLQLKLSWVISLIIPFSNIIYVTAAPKKYQKCLLLIFSVTGSLFANPRRHFRLLEEYIFIANCVWLNRIGRFISISYLG